MSRWMIAAGLTVAAALLPAAGRAAPGKPVWGSDLSAAKAEAKRTGKPIFLVFRCVP